MIKVVTKEPMFVGIDDIESTQKGFSYHKADAIVSAANSFGIMDGGSDVAIIDILGRSVATEVRNHIKEYYYGELPVGGAFSIEVNHPQYKYLIIAPTLRVPKSITNTDNVYHAMRAVLIQMKRHGIKSVVMPMLGTGYGQMYSEDAGKQMILAMKSMTNIPLLFEQIDASEEALNRTKR